VKMTENQIFICQNRNCDCEVRVIKNSIAATSNPQCCCGTVMKKRYTLPVLREITPYVHVAQTAQYN
jgi:hypothetical protein